ncbi:hypothetical protein PLICRDRAFT_42787 [Plicaturopsis crispa FD-325 SS-3]|nr:hypothetical protein PLICRDRAFT_42787 [Plicaturopsis crispa FD-325 SS-3]
MVKRGAFIVFEGLDRSGKSTQASILHDRLQASNIPVVLLKFPDRTTAIGQMIDAYLCSQSELDDRAVHLLFSANRWELASTIERHLAAGTAVLCDRYAFSGIAFSAAKGLPLDWCRAPDIGLPAPDLTLFFDVALAVARARGGYGEERYEKEELQKKVRGVFGTIGAQMQKGKVGVWEEIDASGTMEEVSAKIWGAVGAYVEAGVDQPLERLWVDLPLGA